MIEIDATSLHFEPEEYSAFPVSFHNEGIIISSGTPREEFVRQGLSLVNSCDTLLKIAGRVLRETADSRNDSERFAVSTLANIFAILVQCDA